MARAPAVAALLKSEDFVAAFKDAFKEMGFDPLKIEQVLMLVPVPGELGPIGDEPSFVLRFSPPVDIDALAKAMLGRASKSLQIVSVTVAGKKCYKFEANVEEPPKTEKPEEPVRRPYVPRTITCIADDRTVLACPAGEAGLKRILNGGVAKSPLRERLRRLDASDDMVLVFALEPVRKEIAASLARAKASPRASPEVPLDEILLLSQSATIKVNLRDASLSSAVLQAADAAAAAKVEEQIKVFQQKAKEGISEERKRLDKIPEEYRKLMEEMMSVLEKLLDAMTWAKSGTQVTITLKGDKAVLGEALAKMVSSKMMRRPARVDSTKKPARESVPKRSDEKRE
jgi:hypothetical protein